MALFKRGSVWWMRLSHNGKQRRKSTGTADRKLAERIYHKLLGDIAEGKWFERLPGEEKTFREMMDRYMAEHSIPNKASSEKDRSSLTHLLPFFGSYRISQIKPSRINEYKGKRRLEEASPCTINRELALMKHAYSLALKEWEWVHDNPVKKVSMEKEPPSRDRWLTDEEEETLLSVSPLWLRPMILFAVETGCRRGEMLSLSWRSVDLSRRVITINRSKTGEKRSIPLTQLAVDVLKERENEKVRSIKEDLVFAYPPGKRVNPYTLKSAFEKAMERAHIEDFRWHDLRHTFASRLAQAGIDPYAIQRLMGHKSFSTTQRYAHHHVESLRRGIETLEARRVQGTKGPSTKLAQSSQTARDVK